MPDDIINKPTEIHKSFKLRQVEMERKLDDHITESRAYREENQIMFRNMMKGLQDSNDAHARAQEDNAQAISQLAAATAGVIEVYAASQGAIKVGAVIGRFIKWVSGIGAVLTAFFFAWTHGGNPPPGT